MATSSGTPYQFSTISTNLNPKVPPAPPPAPHFSFTIPESLARFNIPRNTYLAQHQESYIILTGALIFDSRSRLLIVQRAAHDSLPLLWEIPGGGCEAADETILHGVAREVWEESGLKLCALGPLVGSREGNLFTTRRGTRYCKFSFVAEVESAERVVLDPNEHQSYIWVTEEECRRHRVEDDDCVIPIKFTAPEQEATILEGFRMRKEARGADGRYEGF